ncbi:cyclic nucleotide-binding domain protein (macronuclear) [Tetrahymena thermophila SB210]|uniref:Cyclic nucleotide-binding domain protein n=1 Tax=Tetrahymena thermophila (strain SB210) TaxID=312017 RepID=I7M7B4_TETTS|nr:cyclic nucleotide-binding domain protein [Tetrahymena thermophila SB210]EAR90913.3 cyclic nucleotide-binding domain protein [Tetrahymena thermophila SB210]|eukprot:XP_001011158.3 cyclic nucleotide-binding domain protein [Tetrahymena thermophila SB210]
MSNKQIMEENIQNDELQVNSLPFVKTVRSIQNSAQVSNLNEEKIYNYSQYALNQFRDQEGREEEGEEDEDQYESSTKRQQDLETIQVKLVEIFKRFKIRRVAQKLINSIRSRMLKNMSSLQYNFLNDKCQDFSDIKNSNSFKKINRKLPLSKFFKQVRKTIDQLPVINPMSISKKLWDTLIVIVLLYSFFIIPIMVSFGIDDDIVLLNYSIEQIFVFNVLDIFIHINTGFYEHGILCNSRQQIRKKYYIRDFMSLLDLFLKVILIAHICACIWIFTGKFSEFLYENSWISKNQLINESWYIQYLQSFYFCTLTMTTVGYGDIVPVTPIETIVCILMMLFASGVFGFSITTINGILEQFYKNKHQILQKMFIIKNYMQKKSINQILQRDITEYLEYVWKQNQNNYSEEENKMIKLLPHYLRSQLYEESNKFLLRESPILYKNFSEDLLKAIVPMIQERSFTPNELIFQNNEENLETCLYFIQQGQVENFLQLQENEIPIDNFKKNSQKQIKIFKKGEYFGEIEFFTGKKPQTNVKSMDFTTLLILNRSDFIKMLQKYPQDLEQYCQIRDKILYNNDYSKIFYQCYSCCRLHNKSDSDDIKNVTQEKIVRSSYKFNVMYAAIQQLMKKKKSILFKKIIEILYKFSSVNLLQIKAKKIQTQFIIAKYLAKKKGQNQKIEITEYDNQNKQQNNNLISKTQKNHNNENNNLPQMCSMNLKLNSSLKVLSLSNIAADLEYQNDQIVGASINQISQNYQNINQNNQSAFEKQKCFDFYFPLSNFEYDSQKNARSSLFSQNNTIIFSMNPSQTVQSPITQQKQSKSKSNFESKTVNQSLENLDENESQYFKIQNQFQSEKKNVDSEFFGNEDSKNNQNLTNQLSQNFNQIQGKSKSGNQNIDFSEIYDSKFKDQYYDIYQKYPQSPQSILKQRVDDEYISSSPMIESKILKFNFSQIPCIDVFKYNSQQENQNS